MIFEPLDLMKAVRSQYGLDRYLVLKGLHAFDWQSISFDELKYYSVPVIIVPSDYIRQVEKVHEGVSNYKSLFKKFSEWLLENCQLKFNYCNPIILPNNESSGRWVYRSELARSHGTDEPHLRLAYFEEISKVIKKNLPSHPDINFVAAVYCGNDANITHGAADGVSPYDPTAIPPSCLAYDFDIDYKIMSNNQRVLMSGFGHEMFHQWGVNHPDEHSPHWGWSLSSNATIPNVKVFKEELEKLEKSPYLTKL